MQAVDSELGEELQFSDSAAPPPPKLEDPPTLVALLCGGPLAGQQASLTSAQMILQQLQTHNPREGFQGDEAIPASPDASASETSDPASSSPQTSAHDARLAGAPLQRRTDLTGLHFVPYFITSGLQAMPITAAELYGQPAATLEFKSCQGVRPLLSLQQLGQQLKDAADVALSTIHAVSGRAGELGEALEQAGVPFVGPSSDAAYIAGDKYLSAPALIPLLPLLCHGFHLLASCILGFRLMHVALV